MAVIFAECPCFFDLSYLLQTCFGGWCVVTKFADMIDSFFAFSKLTAKFLLLLNSHVWVVNIPCQHNIAPLFRVADAPAHFVQTDVSWMPSLLSLLA